MKLFPRRPGLLLGLVLVLAGCADRRRPAEDRAGRRGRERPTRRPPRSRQQGGRSGPRARRRAHELEIAELEARSSAAEAERGVREAALALAEAERDLAVFKETERPHAIAEAVLELDEADHRRESEQDELNELIAMYAAEDFAAMTKELVLKRGRKNLEFAERELELARAELAHCCRTRPCPRRSASSRPRSRRRAASTPRPRTSVAKARLEGTKALAEARQEIAVLERPLEDDDERGQGSGERGLGPWDHAGQSRLGPLVGPLWPSAALALGPPRRPQEVTPEHAFTEVPKTLDADRRARRGRSLARVARGARRTPSGSWGIGSLDGLLEYGFSVESYYDWQLAASALAVLALAEAPTRRRARRTALERGVQWLCTHAPARPRQRLGHRLHLGRALRLRRAACAWPRTRASRASPGASWCARAARRSSSILDAQPGPRRRLGLLRRPALRAPAARGRRASPRRCVLPALRARAGPRLGSPSRPCSSAPCATCAAARCPTAPTSTTCDPVPRIYGRRAHQRRQGQPRAHPGVQLGARSVGEQTRHARPPARGPRGLLRPTTASSTSRACGRSRTRPTTPTRATSTSSATTTRRRRSTCCRRREREALARAPAPAPGQDAAQGRLERATSSGSSYMRARPRRRFAEPGAHGRRCRARPAECSAARARAPARPSLAPRLDAGAARPGSRRATRRDRRGAAGRRRALLRAASRSPAATLPRGAARADAPTSAQQRRGAARGLEPRALDAARDRRARRSCSRARTRGDARSATRLEEAFRYADVGELCALYRSLALLPEPRALRLARRRGLPQQHARRCSRPSRCDTPYPVRHFDDVAWRQLVIKCLFVEAPLWRVFGLDAAARRRARAHGARPRRRAPQRRARRSTRSSGCASAATAASAGSRRSSASSSAATPAGAPGRGAGALARARRAPTGWPSSLARETDPRRSRASMRAARSTGRIHATSAFRALDAADAPSGAAMMSRMRFFDPHIHMTSRTTDDLEAMAAAGVRAVIEPAFWVGQPRTQLGTFVDYFSSLVGWERFRAVAVRRRALLRDRPQRQGGEQRGAWRARCSSSCRASRFKEGVVAIGEIGYDEITPAEERAYTRQLEFAREHDMVVMVHSPHRDKKRGIRALARASRARSACRWRSSSSTTTTRRRSRTRSSAGAWAAFTIYPHTKMGSERMVEIVQAVRARAHHRRQLGRLGRLAIRWRCRRRRALMLERGIDARSGRARHLAERARRLRRSRARSTSTALLATPVDRPDAALQRQLGAARPDAARRRADAQLD